MRGFNQAIKAYHCGIAGTVSFSLLILASVGVNPARAQDGASQAQMMAKMKQFAKKLPHPMPSGLFGTYMLPKKGKAVLNYGYTHVEVDGMIAGSNEVSPEWVVANTPNPFFGLPGQPATQRIIPTHLEVDVHKFAGLLSVTDNLAIAGLLPFIRKEIDAVTFNGPGTARIGTSNNVAEGVGDIKVGLVGRLYDDPVHHVLFDAILSLPSGSINKTGTVLAPNGVRNPTRLFYGMQLGSGTVDSLLGLAYWGKKGQWGWGAQYLATLRLEDENSEGYRLGNKHEATAWMSYRWMPQLTTSLRMAGSTEEKIHGSDPLIVGPATGADPNNYGGEKLELFGGINIMPFMGHDISLEVGMPVYQDRNGVQGDHQWTINAGWRVVF